MDIYNQVGILIFKFEDPNKALFAVNLLLEHLPNTLLEEQESYNYWLAIKDQLIKKYFK